MCLAVLKTRSNKYLLDISLDKCLKIYFLADWKAGLLFPFVNFYIIFTAYAQHIHMHKYTETYIQTQIVKIRHLTSLKKTEVIFFFFAFSLCFQYNLEPCQSHQNWIPSVKLIWNSLSLICLPLNLLWHPSKFIFPSLDFNFIVRSFSWEYFW